uniref:RAD51-associated protein 1 isoform X5 n=1 Tax=Solea senegalensis TaxID=28829 RepID=UPI001CD89115|nr:RAD51-associated protein 1 isoform X5 [Solea senegalensis]
MERPSRKTKAVNYRESTRDFDDDDDDDFAFVKAPPSKKAREDHKKLSSSSSSQETSAQSTLCQKSRKPLDQKLYERDLEAAITLSSLNYADEIKDRSPAGEGDVKVLIPADENADPASRHLSNCSVDGAVLGLDEISSETGSSASSRQRKSCAVPKEEDEDEDEDYRPKLTPESDEDFSEAEESEDDEFTSKKVSKLKKKENVTEKTKTKSTPVSKKEKQPPKAAKSKPAAAAGSTPVRSPPAAKSAPRRPAQSSTVSTAKPAASVSPAGGRIPKWNPPGQLGKSPTSSLNAALKSPGQGLRLGLSRLVRVKPLHPSVAGH